MRAAILRSGILLTLAALGTSAATAQTELFFATGVDSTGWAQAQSNADGHVLIESPQYPHGLWLHLIDEAGDALTGLLVEYQGRPDSLVAIRCVDPAGGVRETLVWTRPDGTPLRLTLEPRETTDLPAGLASIDWQIDTSVESSLEQVEEIRLSDWEAMAAFLRGRWQGQTGRVAVQLNVSTPLAVDLDRPKAIETLVAHLQQMYRPAGASLGENTTLYVQVFRGGFALQEGVLFYLHLPLFADWNLESVVRQVLGRPQGLLISEDFAHWTRLKAESKDINSLAGLEHLTALYWLELRDNQIVDVNPLANLTNLEYLWLTSNQIADVEPLTGLKNLLQLWLTSNQIADVGPLTGLKNLQTLFFGGNQIADVEPLAGLKNLQTLGLSLNQIADVEPLAGLKNLQYLSLGSNPITDVTPLAGLTNLQLLSLSYNPITDVTPLAGLTNLQSLNLDHNQITDVTPLAGLTNLQSLHLNHNQITDVEPLAGLTNLYRLDLHINQIANVEPLADLKNLNTLQLYTNQITDVGPLADLTNLQSLYLRHNQITDVTPLAGLNNLNWLELSNNQIEDLAPLVANPGLGKGTRVFLKGNPLSDQARNEQIPALKARGVSVHY